MKLTDYKTWYRILFWDYPTKHGHVVWTRDEGLWEDPVLRNKMKSIGYTEVYCNPWVNGEKDYVYGDHNWEEL